MVEESLRVDLWLGEVHGIVRLKCGSGRCVCLSERDSMKLLLRKTLSKHWSLANLMVSYSWNGVVPEEMAHLEGA